MNTYLFIGVQSIAATVMGWIAIVAALVMGYESGTVILACVVVSFLLAFPVGWVITNKLTAGSKGSA